MKIQKVIEKTNQLLKDSRYSESRIHMYNWLWKKGILKYMETRGLIEFDDQTGRDCMLAFHDNNSMTLHHRDLFKSVDVLINVLLNGTLGGRMHIPVQYPLRGSIGAAAESYFVYQKNHGLKDKTIRCKRRRLSDFIEFLYEYGTHQLPDIDTRCLAAFFENRKYRHRDYFTAVRAFIKYLYKKGIIEKDSSYALYSIGKDIMHVKVPSFYNEDEIRQLEKSISPTSNVGKRDYAMVIICSRLGLRVSDVANLSFKNIDWENDSISLIQYKTGKPLTLPLLPVVGDAIIDYLRNARPESSSDKVFLRCSAPYCEMSPAAVHSAVRTAFERSGVKYGDRHHGGHALRFSLAQRMLERSTPMPVISGTLGHVDANTTRTYTRIDVVHMRQCMLDVPSANDDFYTQRGGLFYD
jgi:integrase